jgi:hypothetical protein
MRVPLSRRILFDNSFGETYLSRESNWRRKLRFRFFGDRFRAQAPQTDVAFYSS